MVGWTKASILLLTHLPVKHLIMANMQIAGSFQRNVSPNFFSTTSLKVSSLLPLWYSLIISERYYTASPVFGCSCCAKIFSAKHVSTVHSGITHINVLLNIRH